MADEVTTSIAAEFVPAEVFERIAFEAAYTRMQIAAILGYMDISNQPGNVVERPQWPKVAATAPGEGTDLSNTAFNPSSQTASASVENGVMITVTDKLLRDGVIRNLEPFARQIGYAVAEKIETDMAAEFADFTSSVGSTGIKLTMVDFLQGLYTLANGSAMGPFVAILHPKQFHDLQQDHLSATGTPIPVVTKGGGEAYGLTIGPSVIFADVPVYQSTACAAVNSNVDRQGYLGPLGLSSGIARAEKLPITVTTQRDESLRATEVVCVTDYADECFCRAPIAGIKVISRA